MNKIFVISVGVINMTSGNTAHNWSIYENKGMFAYLTNKHFLMLAAENTFKIGSNCNLCDNDSQRMLQKDVTVVDVAPCTQEQLLAMLKKNGYDYYPIKAFRSRPKGNKKLKTSYSVK
jgi:hypothetical protein